MNEMSKTADSNYRTSITERTIEALPHAKNKTAKLIRTEERKK